MTGKYQKYPSYTNVDEAWLPTGIPTHWLVKKVQFLLKDGQEGIKIGPFGSALKLEDMVESGYRVYGQENVIKRDFSIGKRLIPKTKFTEMSVYSIRSRDVLVTMMGTSGKCQLVPKTVEEGIIDSHLLRLRLNEKEVVPELFCTLLDECHELKYQIGKLGKGSIMHGLNSSIVKNLCLPLPPLEEQRTVVAFLKHETAKIDTLIEKQQQLIKLLKEKRQAVISQAVTKGLNPSAPMKDSGVDWLGEVPDIWTTAKLRYLVQESVAGPYGASLTKAMYTSEGYRVYGQQQVIAGDFTVGDYYISDKKYEEMARYTAHPGDVLISVMGTIGRVAVVPINVEKGIINPRLVRYKFGLFVVSCGFDAARQHLNRAPNEINHRNEVLGITIATGP